MKRLLILLAVVGCVAKDGGAAPADHSAQSHLSIWPDSVHGVVCYSASGYKDISCVKVQP